MHLEDSRYALIEVKLGGNSLIDEGIKKLKLLNKKIEENNKKKPTFSMIITGSGPAYKTEDGIYIVPINMLKD